MRSTSVQPVSVRPSGVKRCARVLDMGLRTSWDIATALGLRHAQVRSISDHFVAVGAVRTTQMTEQSDIVTIEDGSPSARFQDCSIPLR